MSSFGISTCDKLTYVSCFLYFIHSGGADTVSPPATMPAVQSARTVALLCLYQTNSTVSAFLLAMILFPDVLAAARREIDEVVGGNTSVVR